jgi:hypothetical protein
MSPELMEMSTELNFSPDFSRLSPELNLPPEFIELSLDFKDLSPDLIDLSSVFNSYALYILVIK